MAKTRAQRKAERRAREAEEQKRSSGHDGPSEAQHDTQVPFSGEVAEVEAVEMGIGAGAPESQLETPDAPKPRSARRAEAREAKEAEKRKREDQKRREEEKLERVLLERLASKESDLNIDDIRLFYENDLRFLEQF